MRGVVVKPKGVGVPHMGYGLCKFLDESGGRHQAVLLLLFEAVGFPVAEESCAEFLDQGFVGGGGGDGR